MYGHGKPPFKENDIPSPNDPYAIAKYAGELDVKVAGEQHELDWCIVRPYNVYGKRQNIKDKYRNVLGIFMNQYLNDKPLTIFGDGTQVRSFTNVDCILEPLYVAGISEWASKRTFNLGSDVPYTVKEVAEMLMEIMCGGEIEYLEKRHEVHTAVADNKNAVNILRFKNKISLYEGLKDMYEWVKTNPIPEATKSPNYEITKGMYNAWKK